MGIRKRQTVDPAAIERFGDAADASAQAAALSVAPTTTPIDSPVMPAKPDLQSTGKAESSGGVVGEWPKGVGRTLLVRWPEPDLAIVLAEVAALEDRSQHKTALRALKLGLEALRAEHERDR